jgi:hypothetical protein
MSARTAETLWALPFLERFVRPRREAGEHMSQLVFYNCQNTLELLEDSGLHCPPLKTYLPKLVEFFSAHHRKQSEEDAAVDDPLDSSF